MQDDFFDDLELDDEDDDLEATPDWMNFADDQVEEDEGDQFDMLRQKSARAGSSLDAMSEDDAFSSSQGSSSFLQGLTPSQRMILAVLLLLNIIVVGAALVLYF